FASTQEMIEQLRSPSLDLGADVRFAIHNRFLQPILDTTLLFLGLPFVVTRTNRNPFISLGLCLAVVTVFMLINLGCKQLGTNGWLTPALAARLPLMIFAPIAAAASDTLRQYNRDHLVSGTASEAASSIPPDAALLKHVLLPTTPIHPQH